MANRAVAEFIHYQNPPEPGTIVGPNEWGEHLVIGETVDGLTALHYATTEDIKAMYERDDPQSVTEVKMR